MVKGVERESEGYRCHFLAKYWYRVLTGRDPRLMLQRFRPHKDEWKSFIQEINNLVVWVAFTINFRSLYFPFRVKYQVIHLFYFCHLGLGL